MIKCFKLIWNTFLSQISFELIYFIPPHKFSLVDDHNRLERIQYIQQKREDFSLVLGHAWLVKGGVHNRSFVAAFYSLIKTLSEQLAVKKYIFVRNNYRLVFADTRGMVVIRWQLNYITLFTFVHNFHPHCNHPFNILLMNKTIWISLSISIYKKSDEDRKKSLHSLK